MKTLREETQRFTAKIAEAESLIHFVCFPEFDKCHGIEPQPASQLRCSFCNSGELNLLRDPGFPGLLGAGCAACTKSGSYRRQYLRRKESGKEFRTIELPGVGVEFQQACFAGINQKREVDIATLKGFAENPQGFLLLAGSPGTGKTYSAIAIMRHMLEKGLYGRYLETGNLYQTWIPQAGRALGLLESLQDIGFLILDDFGHRIASEGFSEFLHLLISNRKTTQKPTIVITNCNDSEMMKNTTPAILSRITSGIILKFEGRDRRNKKF